MHRRVPRSHAYHWPGNIRELSHMIERAVLLARRGRLSEGDLGIPRRASLRAGQRRRGIAVAADRRARRVDAASLDLRTALETLERQLIDRALAKAGGNRTEAAALLGLNRTTLVEKLRKYAT